MIIVGGGTYWEQCSHPQWSAFFGSAGRAAAAVSKIGEQVRLATFGEGRKLDYLKALGNDYRFELGPIAPGPRILFKYDNPIGAPRVFPARHLLTNNNVVLAEGDVVLRFGAVEGTVVAKGKRVVYDPQDIDAPEPFSANGSVAETLAIVCNLAEGRALTRKENPDEVAQELLAQGASVVVLKLGSAGGRRRTGREGRWPIGGAVS